MGVVKEEVREPAVAEAAATAWAEEKAAATETAAGCETQPA